MANTFKDKIGLDLRNHSLKYSYFTIDRLDGILYTLSTMTDNKQSNKTSYS